VKVRAYQGFVFPKGRINITLRENLFFQHHILI
jgi:hypothetical protein